MPMPRKEHARPFAPALDRLRSVGLRPTRQRLALARLLFENGDRHVTAEMLHAEAQAAAIRVSLATVYNTLHQFTTAGLLREIVVDSQRSYFDTNMTDHHHFYFEKTSELEDIPGEQVVVAQLPAPPAGTEVKRVDVVIRINKK
ncbi:MAG: transcriptional repressor [Rhodospirillales bacterium RIFCSPLOWO2_01_FULL_65_14]|nr:MAG: transcriptional repressor [Rhodospirillales bacterium RIFCSPLOWO2_01_FULL_65_14]